MYMTNIAVNNTVNNKSINGLSPLAQKFIYVDSSYHKNYIKNDNFKQNIKVGDIPSSIIDNKDKIKKTISTAKTVLSVTSSIVNVTDQKEDFKPFLETTSGTLSATEGVIKLTEVKEEENKTKSVLNSVSSVVNGIATVLSVANIPEAEFISFTGKAFDVGVEQQNLTENIKKNNARGIVGSAVGIVRGAWGLTLSGAKVATLGASIGNKFGKVSIETVQKVSSSATKITKLADKIAIPFAIAGTALSYWDWQIARDKYKSKEVERLEELENNPNNLEKLNKLEKEVKSLKIDSTIRGISFGLSAISSTALATSIIFPVSAPVTGPIAVAGSLASSLTSALDNENKRNNINNLYKTSIKYHDKIVSILDKIIFAPKYKKEA
ncbi:MAG: hypothetical protein KatS3mg068_0993 [Candidatus Sericytochromatia bacterium]|nr:MAG: hypothetical protein KatS3mg068_0993 [Candidatus Sericytochromatia bacterium]